MCALIRRLRGPNPLVALPYLWQWNTVLLGTLLFWFRFTLTGTIILIPQSLAIHGFEADQIGPAVIWSAAPLLLVAFIAALLLLRKLDPRLLMAAGFTCTAFAVCLNAEYTTAWSAANYYRTELLTGVGQAFAFIGLVGCIILQGVFSGGLAKPQWILTFSAFFHTIRLFGGTTGAVYMGHFLAEREKLHSNLLGLHVTRGSWITDGNLHALAAGVYAKSSGAAEAAARAVDLIGARLRLQAYALSLNRWVPSGGMGLRCGPSFDRLAAQVAAELRRPQHLAAGEGDKIMKRKLQLYVCFACPSVFAFAQEPGNTAPPRHITLHEAVQLALQHNHTIHIAGYKVEEKQHAKEVAKSAYFPTIRNESNFVHLTDTQLIQLSAGSLGTVAGSPVPPVTSTINQGGREPRDQWHAAYATFDHTTEDPVRRTTWREQTGRPRNRKRSKRRTMSLYTFTSSTTGF